MSRFDVSSITVHEALDRLVNDGFIVTRGRNGTTVTQHPPHLNQYGVVFPLAPSAAEWPRYWTALTNEANGMESGSPRRFRVYHAVADHPGNAAHEALVADARAQRLAGIIFITPPRYLSNSPVIRERAVPMVSLNSATGIGEFPSVVLDYQSFINQSLDDLARRGATKVACLFISQNYMNVADQVAGGIVFRGMSTRTEWIQGMPYAPAEWVGRLVHLMFSGRKSERPDGLFITDDNHVTAATAGCLAAGITSGEELKITAHCNFPWPTPGHLPIRRVGFDVRRTVELACDLIDRSRAGSAVPQMVSQPAVTEDDYAVATSRSQPRPILDSAGVQFA